MGKRHFDDESYFAKAPRCEGKSMAPTRRHRRQSCIRISRNRVEQLWDMISSMIKDMCKRSKYVKGNQLLLEDTHITKDISHQQKVN